MQKFRACNYYIKSLCQQNLSAIYMETVLSSRLHIESMQKLWSLLQSLCNDTEHTRNSVISNVIAVQSLCRFFLISISSLYREYSFYIEAMQEYRVSIYYIRSMPDLLSFCIESMLDPCNICNNPIELIRSTCNPCRNSSLCRISIYSCRSVQKLCCIYTEFMQKLSSVNVQSMWKTCGIYIEFLWSLQASSQNQCRRHLVSAEFTEFLFVV